MPAGPSRRKLSDFFSFSEKLTKIRKKTVQKSCNLCSFWKNLQHESCQSSNQCTAGFAKPAVVQVTDRKSCPNLGTNSRPSTLGNHRHKKMIRNGWSYGDLFFHTRRLFIVKFCRRTDGHKTSEQHQECTKKIPRIAPYSHTVDWLIGSNSAQHFA